MAKRHAAEKGEPKGVATCDNLYEVTYNQSDIERNFRFQLAKEEMEILKSQFATSSWVDKMGKSRQSGYKLS